MKLKPISRARFDALCFLRLPSTKFFVEEQEWYADQNENVLGVLVFDKHDADWGYVVLGRDEVARFRGIDQDISLTTDDEARKALHRKMLSYSATGEDTFPQGLGHKRQKTVQIFQPVVPRNRLHPDFVVLSVGEGYSPAKEILGEIAYTFEDPDGNYIQQFQSDGFDARLWELYLYAVLHENDFFLDRQYKAPDYLCQKYGQTVVVEATTVNPTQVTEGKESPTAVAEGNDLADYMAIKFGSALFSKLQKRYWELDHVRGHPLILAVADLRKPKGVRYSAPFLMEYLYGMRQNETENSITYTAVKEHVYKDKTIHSGFFFQPHADNIAAILFSDGGTISKFVRMGKLAQVGSPDVRISRIGERYPTKESATPEEFEVIVDSNCYKETWSEGIWIIHNPNAKVPLDRQLFEDAAHVYLQNDEVVIYLADQFPIWSKTLILSTIKAVKNVKSIRIAKKK